MNKITNTSLALSCLFALAHSPLRGASNCPTLSLKDLSTAACSSQSKPFETSSLAGVKFYATTPCPSKISISKTLQSVFKGAKNYAPMEKGVVAGQAVCTYSIKDTAWQKALNAENDTFTLTASLPTREHVNYWGAPMVGVKCPDLAEGDLESLKNKSVVIEKTSAPKLEYIFKVGAHGDAGVASSFISGAQGFFRKIVLPKLSGKLTSFKGIDLTCHYTHHTGGKESLLELKSVPAKPIN
jgi:hypothetical protein